jgi:uncharacterized membrane protein
MKKTIIITTIALVGLIVLAKIGFFESLLLFFLVGAIPGTHYNIPSTFMLLAIVSIIWLLLFRFMTVELSSSPTKQPQKRRASHKKRMPKRRYGQV